MIMHQNRWKISVVLLNKVLQSEKDLSWCKKTTTTKAVVCLDTFTGVTFDPPPHPPLPIPMCLWDDETQAKRLSHQACGPVCQPVRPGSPSGPCARWLWKKVWQTERRMGPKRGGARFPHVDRFLELPHIPLPSIFLGGYSQECCHYCWSRWWGRRGGRKVLRRQSSRATSLKMSHTRLRLPLVGAAASCRPVPARVLKCGSLLWPHQADDPRERPCGVELTAAMHEVSQSLKNKKTEKKLTLFVLFMQCFIFFPVSNHIFQTM